MSELKRIDLRGEFRTTTPLEFVRVDVEPHHERQSRFALVWYTFGGEAAQLGLRLDLDKRAFIDRVDEAPEADAEARQFAPEIAKIVGDTLRRNGSST